MRTFVCLLLLVVIVSTPSLGQFMECSVTPPLSTVVYRLRCTTDSTIGNVWPQMDIAWRNAGSDQVWGPITDRLQLVGLRCPQELKQINLSLPGGKSLIAVVALGEGDTTNWLYIVQIITEPSVLPTLQVKLNKSHEGGVDFHWDKVGALESVRLQYVAMHVLSNRSLFPGHIILAREYSWSSSKRSFVAGPFIVDEKAERELSLVDILLYPGTTERLGIKVNHNEKTGDTEYVFQPKGILIAKLPKDVQKARLVKVTLGRSRTSKTGAEEQEVLSIKTVRE